MPPLELLSREDKRLEMEEEGIWTREGHHRQQLAMGVWQQILSDQLLEPTTLQQGAGLAVGLLDGTFQIHPRMEINSHLHMGLLGISMELQLGHVMQAPIRWIKAGLIAEVGVPIWITWDTPTLTHIADRLQDHIQLLHHHQNMIHGQCDRFHQLRQWAHRTLDTRRNVVMTFNLIPLLKLIFSVSRTVFSRIREHEQWNLMMGIWRQALRRHRRHEGFRMELRRHGQEPQQ
jgi:hypothetical protein